jgi:hypothetical protein
MFCIAQFRHTRNGNKLGNLTEWFVFDVCLNGIFMVVTLCRPQGFRLADCAAVVCPTSEARQYFSCLVLPIFRRRLNPAVQSALTWGVRARE